MSLKPLTAIVVSYFTGPRLKECLYALLACPDVDSIFVVDNGNPVEDTHALQALAASQSRMTLIETGENLGFGKATNLAAKRAQDGFLLFVNPDAVIKQDAPARMRTVAEGRRAPWCIGGKVFDLDGREGRGARRRQLTLWRAISTVAGHDTWNLNKAPEPEGPVSNGPSAAGSGRRWRREA